MSNDSLSRSSAARRIAEATVWAVAYSGHQAIGGRPDEDILMFAGESCSADYGSRAVKLYRREVSRNFEPPLLSDPTDSFDILTADSDADMEETS